MPDSFEILDAASAAAAAITGIAGFGPLIGDSAAPYAVISSPNRNIGGLIADCTVEEVHHDEMQVTRHPVETGAQITDHAFSEPPYVEIHAMWSNSSAQSEGYVTQVYEQLQALQQSAQPFALGTGKRDYGTMLMPSMIVVTNPETEYALDLRAKCQAIVITSTTTNSVGSMPGFTDGASAVTPAGAVGAIPAAANQTPADASSLSAWPNVMAANGTVQLQTAPAGTLTWEQQAAALSAPGL